MALGFTSSSSTQTSSTDAPSSTPSTVTTASGADVTSKGANYFFGFLVTFIALLLIFIGCGVGTRRRLQRRRAFLAGLAQWDTDSLSSPPHSEPLLHEPCYVEGGDKWLSIQPLSAYTVTIPSAPNPIEPRPPPIRRPSRNPHAIHGLSLPTWIPNPNRESLEKSREPSLVTFTTPNDKRLQVAVMIAMPSCPRANDDDASAYPKKFEIGVAYETWDSKLDPSV